MLGVTLLKSSFCSSNVILSRCVTFSCFVGVGDDSRSEAVVFQGESRFFPAVTANNDHFGCKSRKCPP